MASIWSKFLNLAESSPERLGDVLHRATCGKLGHALCEQFRTASELPGRTTEAAECVPKSSEPLSWKSREKYQLIFIDWSRKKSKKRILSCRVDSD